MKKSTFLLGILCLFTSTSLLAQSADEAAIKEVCYQEQLARSQRDFDAIQSYWRHVDQASLLSPYDGTNLQGWAAMKQKNKAEALKYFEKAKTLVEVGNVPWIDRMIEEAKKME